MPEKFNGRNFLENSMPEIERKQYFNIKILTLETLIKILTNFFQLLIFFYQKIRIFLPKMSKKKP